MATFVATDYSVVINSVDLSDHVRSATIDYSVEEQDDTAMGDSTRSAAGGLKNWSYNVEFLQDFAASEVDATLFSLVGSTTFATFKPTSGSVTATNPSFSGTALIQSYGPLGSSVGDQAAVTLQATAAGDLARNTS